MSNQDTPQHPSSGTELEAAEQDLGEAKRLEIPQKSDETDYHVDDPVDGEKAAVKVVNKGGLVAWLALLISLTSMMTIGGAYWFWQKQQSYEQQLEQQKVQQWQSQQNEQMQLLEQQLKKQMGDQIASNQNQLKTQFSQVEKTLSETLTTRLSAMDSRLNSVTGRQPNDWTLAEANYLIRIAGRKLWLEDDIETAQSLLATADLRVSELSDPSLYPLRQSISQDIAALRALPNPRVTDIHLTLSGLISNIDTLVINTVEIHTEKPREVKDNTLTDSPADWKDNFFKSMDDIVSRLLFVNSGVAEGDIQPLKMPRQQWFLRANLKMAMLQAQVAILSRDEVVFKETLTRAIEWLKHFKQTDSGVQATALTLTSLLQDPIKADYPDQFISQQLLKKLLLERLGEDYQKVGQETDQNSEKKGSEQGKETPVESAPAEQGGAL